MNDLAWGVALLGTVAVVLFLAARALGRRLSPAYARGLALATTAAIGFVVACLSDNILIAKFLPVSNLIVVGNPIPLLVSVLAGLAWSLIPGTSKASGVRRVVAVLTLQGLGWLTVVQPLWGEAPRCRDRWEGDFCLQSTETTCTAACAATLLRAHGIPTTEQEMADLCLTRRGTLQRGLFRGLKLKTAGTPWDVEIIRGSFDDLKRLGDGPCILMTGLPPNREAAAIYVERYGWTPGEWHSVLFYGFRKGGLVAMGDPTPGIGRENWSEDDLRLLWNRRGMRLVRRRSATASSARTRLAASGGRALQP
jgi:hypothetical protein